jgi:cell migration-inducing and hyaluronan-binding protein
MARKTPADTYVKDSSVNESMTRWYVLHSTLGVTFARNVGYKSIGHGYYLEEGTEADNAFYANIGILARASLENEQNPRRIPGILSDNSPREKQGGVDGHGQDYFPYFSDYNHPSVF